MKDSRWRGLILFKLVRYPKARMGTAGMRGGEWGGGLVYVYTLNAFAVRYMEVINMRDN